MGADGRLEDFEVGVLVLRFLETLCQGLEVDLRQVECRRSLLAYFVAGDGFIEQAADLAELFARPLVRRAKLVA